MTTPTLKTRSKKKTSQMVLNSLKIWAKTQVNQTKNTKQNYLPIFHLTKLSCSDKNFIWTSVFNAALLTCFSIFRNWAKPHTNTLNAPHQAAVGSWQLMTIRRIARNDGVYVKDQDNGQKHTK